MKKPPAVDTPSRLIDGCAALGVSLDLPQVERLLDLARQILEKNKTLNLTAARDLETLVDDHILDSLTLVPLIAPHVNFGTQHPPLLIDVGSGGGFPALVLAIALPSLRVLCVESIGKKARALATISQALGLETTSILNDRSERVAHDPQWRERADLATARAVGHLATACELTLPFLRRGGLFLAQRGPDPRDEIAQAGSAIRQLGGQLDRIVAVKPDRPNGPRTVVIIEKTGPTPDRFPRRPPLPAKRPLGGRPE